MSVEAITWALKQPITKSSTKFVLVVLANCADGQSFECYPSISYLCEATSQNRKTIFENLKRLTEDGFLIDTGERKGATGRVKEYRLNVRNSTENGTVKEYQKRDDLSPETVPKTELLNSTNNGTIKQYRKRNGSENGMVPFLPSNSPENGTEIVPKTVPVYVSKRQLTVRKECTRICATTSSPSEDKKKKPMVTFDSFVSRRKEAGEKLIREDDPIFDWADRAGIPEDWLRMAWIEFSTRYKGQAKRYADWPATFRNAVRQNWYRLWRLGNDNQYLLTTEGEMARRVLESRDREVAA